MKFYLQLRLLLWQLYEVQVTTADWTDVVPTAILQIAIARQS